MDGLIEHSRAKVNVLLTIQALRRVLAVDVDGELHQIDSGDCQASLCCGLGVTRGSSRAV